MSRSYFEPDGVPPGSTAAMVPMSLSFLVSMVISPPQPNSRASGVSLPMFRFGIPYDVWPGVTFEFDEREFVLHLVPYPAPYPAPYPTRIAGQSHSFSFLRPTILPPAHPTAV